MSIPADADPIAIALSALSAMTTQLQTIQTEYDTAKEQLASLETTHATSQSQLTQLASAHADAQGQITSLLSGLNDITEVITAVGSKINPTPQPDPGIAFAFERTLSFPPGRFPANLTYTINERSVETHLAYSPDGLSLQSIRITGETYVSPNTADTGVDVTPAPTPAGTPITLVVPQGVDGTGTSTVVSSDPPVSHPIDTQ